MQVPSLTAVSGSHSLPRLAGGELDTVLLWYRRDLRIADNPALTAALNAAKTVVSLELSGLKSTTQLLSHVRGNTEAW